MSDEFRMQLGGIDGVGDEGFKIKTICGCRIVYGSVPLSSFAMLTHGFSKKALMATDIADLIGATFVIGEPTALDELRHMDLPVSAKRHADYLAATNLGLIAVAMWLRRGARGKSSNAMCKAIYGVPADAGTEFPHDPDDLRRCLLFVEATGAQDQFQKMIEVSPEWSRLVARWDELAARFAEETAEGKQAPKTYALMQELIGETGSARWEKAEC